MKTAISIPDPLFKRVEKTRKRLKLSRSELFARAVERYLAELPARDIPTMTDAELTRELNRTLPADTRADRALTELQARTVDDDEW